MSEARSVLQRLLCLVVASLLIPVVLYGQPVKTATTTVPATASLVPTAATTCADVLFLGAMGSDQRKNWRATVGLGYQVYNVYKRLASALPARTVRPVPIDYPARSTNLIKPTNTELVAVTGAGLGQAWAARDYRKRVKKYLAGLADGVNTAYADVTSAAVSCPTQAIVLSGYSQGAMVMHRLLNRLAANHRTSILNRVAGVVLVADGDKTRHNDIRTIGAPATGPKSQGIGAFVAAQPNIPTSIRGLTFNFCTRGDMVCDFRFPASLIEFSLGTGIHSTDYMDLKRYDNPAAAAIANVIMGWPKPAPLVQTQTATVGKPVHVQLKVSVRANMVSRVRWLLPSGLPSGLSMSGLGLITGTPTQTGTWTTTYRVRSAAAGVFALPIAGTVTWRIGEPGPLWTFEPLSPAPSDADPTRQDQIADSACGNQVCVATRMYDDSGAHSHIVLLASSSGGPWSTTAAVLDDGTGYQAHLFTLGHLDCDAHDTCVAMGKYEASNGRMYAAVVAYKDGTWSIKQPPIPDEVTSDFYGPSRISCGANVCAILGSYGGITGGLVDTPFFVVLWTYDSDSGTWSAAQPPEPPGLDTTTRDPWWYVGDLSCGTNECVAVGSGAVATSVATPPDTDTGMVWNYRNGNWSVRRAPVPSDIDTTYPYSYLNTPSCGGNDTCAMGGSYRTTDGRRVRAFWLYDHGEWSVSTPATPADASSSNPTPAYAGGSASDGPTVLCGTTGTCTALGMYRTRASATGDSFAYAWWTYRGTWTVQKAPLPADATVFTSLFDPYAEEELHQLACTVDGAICTALVEYPRAGSTGAGTAVVEASGGSLTASTWTPQASIGPMVCVNTCIMVDTVPRVLKDGHWLESQFLEPFTPTSRTVDGMACSRGDRCVAYGAIVGEDTHARGIWTTLVDGDRA